MDEFRTKRLRWRQPRASDVDAYMAFVSDYEVVKWTATWPHPAEREFFACRCILMAPELGFAGPVFAAEEMIGGVGGDPTSIMFFMDPAQWGRGLATEALHGFLDWAFEQFALPELAGGAMVDNPASQRVLEKLGCEFARHDTCTPLARLEPAPQLLYRLTRQRFGATR